ncbi:MAG: hypothetical protein AABO58_18280 [Acidobacteriota bacterium]
MSYDSKQQIFLYHAYAHGCGGFLERKNQLLAIPSVGGAALSIAGGEAYGETGRFEWAPPFEPDPPRGFYLAVDRVTSHLWTEETEHAWITNADVRVYGFNLSERVKVGLMVNRLTSTHLKGLNREALPDGGQPHISFNGSQFWNVFIDNAPVAISVDSDLDSYPTHVGLKGVVTQATPTPYCPGNLSVASPQYMRDLATKYTSNKLTRCSIVGEIGHGKAYGYSVDLTDSAAPDDPSKNLGRVFFGEMLVGDEMKRLNMIRWDLGCDSCGGGSGGGADMNGLPMP